MKTVPKIRKHTLVLAIGSALLAPFASYAANGQQIARNGQHLDVAPGDYATTSANMSVLFALNGGSITATDANVVSTGSNAHGIEAISNSNVTATHVSVTTAGAGASGILASQNNTLVKFEGGDITTTGNAASAVRAYLGGKVDLLDTSMNTSGERSHGMDISTGATVNATHVNIATGGDNAYGIFARNAGDGTTNPSGTVIATGVNVSTQGQDAYGVLADGLGSGINFNGGSVTTTGLGSTAVQAKNGAYMDLVDITIETSGDHAHGIHAENGGNFNTTRVDITTAGDHAHGVLAEGAGSLVYYRGGSITTAGFAAKGISAESGAFAQVTGTTIKTNGEYGFGIETGGPGTLVGLFDTSIETSGQAAYGILSGPGSRVDAGDTSIETSGQGAYGVYAAAGDIHLSRSTIKTTGQNADGMVVTGGTFAGRLSTYQVDISTSGTDSFGLNVAGDSASANIFNSSIKTTGAGSWGVVLDRGAVVDLQDSHVRTEGARAWGAYVFDGTLNIKGGSLVSAQHGAIRADGDAAIAVSNGAQIIGGNGTLLSIANENSAVSLSMDNGVYAEGDIVGADSNGDGTVRASAEVSLSNASHWRGATHGAVSQLSLAGGSQWTMTGDSTVGQLSLGDGVIAFQDPTPTGGDFKTLTVTGDFASNGGTLLMNAALGDDASATDKLHVMGNTSGQANVVINNVSNQGAQTVEGIKIVQVDGRSDGQFDLAERAVGGFYEYFLFKGGKTDPNDGDWYLRSELKDPPTVEPCTTPIICKDPPTVVPCTTPFVCIVPIIVPCTTPIICDAPVIEPPPPRPRPVLRPEAGAYLANQSAAVNLFQQAMHDRLGEPGLAERLKSDDTLNSAWVRTAGDQADYGPLAKQLEVSSHRSVLQIGADLARWGQSSRGQVGVMAATGQANNTVVSNLTGYTAKGKVEGTALGVYANWFADPGASTGAYVDGWVQYGRFKNSVHGEGLQKEKYDARTVSGSVESGYAFRVFEGERSAVFVEPQAQLTYTDYRGGGTTEHNGTVVASEKAGGLSARTGVRIYGHDRTEQGHRVQPFAAVNWLHDRSRNAMSFDGAQMTGGAPKDRYEVNAGVQLLVSNRWSGWGSLGLQSGANDYRNAGAQLGAKYSW